MGQGRTGWLSDLIVLTEVGVGIAALERVRFCMIA